MDLARICGFHRRGIKGDAVVLYCEPLITQHMESTGAPSGEN